MQPPSGGGGFAGCRSRSCAESRRRAESPYAVLTFAEVLVSPTGLELAYSQAPLSMKGVPLTG